jgi:carbonic anhydrase/acetyltransferase-like protein (isoleucine patch superfamily)
MDWPMTAMTTTPQVLRLEDGTPDLADDAWVAPGATVVGDVVLSAQANVWYGAVLRADLDRIEIGPRSNVQDGSVIHADPGFPVRIGTGVTIGHRAVVHGTVTGDNVLIGMGAVLMNGVRLGDDVLVAAGTVLLEGIEVPSGSLVAGVPGKVRRPLTDDEVANIRSAAKDYEQMTRVHSVAQPSA